MNLTEENYDEIDFFYILKNHGWSTCIIYKNKDLYFMEITHVISSNPIDILLDRLIALINGATEVDFSWYDEPGEYKWNIKRNQKQQHKINVSITDCLHYDSEIKSEIVTLEFEVKLRLFLICVLSQMQKINDSMSEKSFKKNRQGDFPFYAFNKFKKAYNKVYEK